VAEDRRIALAALAVTAIIGVAAPLAAIWHDSNRLHAEQAQSDRVELRKVLDDAAGALYILGTRLQTARPGTQLDRGSSLQHRIDGLARLYNRVAIRLGRGAPAAKEMKRGLAEAADAYLAFRRLGSVLTSSKLDDQAAQQLASDFASTTVRYTREVDRFIDQANRVARSTTD
jgi:hypothetical protein